jgi:hypothetical protein
MQVMKKKVRLFLALFILTISISLLMWGYAPYPRETRVQPIAPTEMQLSVP